jgi:hypothetical protein
MKAKSELTQSTYYVAGLARYVLVQASSPDEAKAKGEAALEKLARVVRLATQDEIDLQAFHDRMVRDWCAGSAEIGLGIKKP